MKIILKSVREETWNAMGGGALQLGNEYGLISIKYIYDNIVDTIDDSVWMTIFEEICIL